MNVEDVVLIQPSLNLPDKDHLRFYRGKSMRGTFRPSDCLRMKPILLPEVRSGDVVIFHKRKHQNLIAGNCQGDEDPLVSEVHAMEESQSGDELVHRVIAIHPEGLVTRGDSNTCVDADLVTADNLVGKVTHLERGWKLHPVQGGWVGLWRARLLRIWKYYLWKHIVRLGSRPYHWLNSSGWIARYWHPSFMKLHLSSQDGPLVKYIYRRRTVARWWPLQNRFECQKPYDLVLRREDLPRDVP